MKASQRLAIQEGKKVKRKTLEGGDSIVDILGKGAGHGEDVLHPPTGHAEVAIPHDLPQPPRHDVERFSSEAIAECKILLLTA